jgi:hypothetical protein
LRPVQGRRGSDRAVAHGGKRDRRREQLRDRCIVILARWPLPGAARGQRVRPARLRRAMPCGPGRRQVERGGRVAGSHHQSPTHARTTATPCPPWPRMSAAGAGVEGEGGDLVVFLDLASTRNPAWPDPTHRPPKGPMQDTWKSQNRPAEPHVQNRQHREHDQQFRLTEQSHNRLSGSGQVTGCDVWRERWSHP